MSSFHLHFNTGIGQQKPESIFNKNTQCPFCDRQNLKDILAEKGPIILVKNKYPVLQDTFQTVLIETECCEGDLSTYPKEHLYNVISFGINKWLEMEKSGEYKSVIFFKNHGPKSGGTIFHPHMQIVGLKKINYRDNFQKDYLEGIVISKKNQVELNISTKPRVGFFEFNIILSDLTKVEQMADFIQIIVHYVLNSFNKNCDSYNLFFYEFDNEIIAKIMPRFITSPIYIGYSIPQVSNRSAEVVKEIKEIYNLNP
ncbi:MAG: galactose-1-phosphate uridylyltransferase [Peptococcaceae bacterium BICA1-8]|nr:MAG: galactose-1-phosphate uridylyltransferase [Peptococcaceae bacterium BICA1-8]